MFEILSSHLDFIPTTHDLRREDYKSEYQQLRNNNLVLHTDIGIDPRHKMLSNQQLKDMHFLPMFLQGIRVGIRVTGITLTPDPNETKDFITSVLNGDVRNMVARANNALNIVVVKAANLASYREALDSILPYQRIYSMACTTATSHVCRVYINDSAHVICLLTNQISNKIMQKLIAIIPAACDWIGDNPNIPKDMYLALGKGDSAGYERAFVAWQNSVALQYMTTKKAEQKSKAISNLFKLNTTAMQNKCEQLRREINNIETNLQTYYTELKQILLKISAIQNLEGTTHDDTIEYLIKHPRIYLVDAPSSNTIRFGINTPLINYDADLLRSFIDSPKPNQYNSDVNKSLYTALFLNDKYRLWLRFNIVWSYSSDQSTWHLYRASNVSNSTIVGNTEIGLINPHLHSYNCFGQNRSYIDKALADDDYILAIEQSIATVGTLNFADGIVMSALDSVIHRHIQDRLGVRCVENTETNEFYTLAQFNDILQG